MIELEFAELHGPIFINGTNLSPKLIPGDGPGHRRDIKLFYCRKERELHVHFKSKIGIVPRENVALMVEKSAKSKMDEVGYGFTKVSEDPVGYAFVPTQPVDKVTAQVDSPMHHVFKGEGHGKTGRDK